jgi:hypothetical protein
MPTTTKSSKKAKPTATATSPEFVDIFSPVVINTVESIADLQKKTLDVTAEQTAEWIGAWKKAFTYFPVPAPTFFFDAAVQAVQTVTETQKSAIDLVVEQTKATLEIAKVRGEAYTKVAAGVTSAVKNSVARSAEAQKQVLEFAGEQNKAFFEATKQHLGAAAGPATAVVDTFQRGTDAVLEAQKSLLNMAVTASKN